MFRFGLAIILCPYLGKSGGLDHTTLDIVFTAVRPRVSDYPLDLRLQHFTNTSTNWTLRAELS